MFKKTGKMKDTSLDRDRWKPDHVSERKMLAGPSDFPKGKLQNDACLFTFDKRLDIALTSENQDFSRYNTFILKAFNFSGTLLVGLKHLSNGKIIASTGEREPLPPGIWTELVFPVESFGVFCRPSGQADDETMEITFKTEKTESRNTPISIALKSFEGMNQSLPSGPRLTMKGLRGVLKADIRGVTSFFTGKDDCPIPSHHPFTIRNNGFFIPSPCPEKMEKNIVAGIMTGKQKPTADFWKQNPCASFEWSHFFHRHHFMKTLLKISNGKNHQMDIEILDRLIKDWIIHHPIPLNSNGGAGPAWETLSAAWRVREWLWVVGIAWKNPSFSRQTAVFMLRSLWEHCRHLMDYQGHPNNWIIVESAALAMAGMIFPQFKEGNIWVRQGIERLKKEFNRQFFPDGVHYELSLLYHAICLNAYLDVKVCAEKKNIPLPREFYSPLEKCFEYLCYLCRPDFTWPSINDSWGINGDYRALLSFAGQIFKRPDFIWIGSEGKAGREPEKKTVLFPDAGITVMRSGYERTAHYLLFRSGPPGAYHRHDDQLSIDVAHQGIKRLVDPGITTYEPGALTRYYRSARAHNTVLINGRGPDNSQMTFGETIHPAKNRIYLSHDDHMEMAGGHYRLVQKDQEYIVSRSIAFIDKTYWIIHDSVQGQGQCEINVIWQCLSETVSVDKKTFVIRFQDPDDIHFSITPFLIPPGLTCELIRADSKIPGGWASVDGTDMPCTSIKFSLFTPLPVSLKWVLSSCHK